MSGIKIDPVAKDYEVDSSGKLVQEKSLLTPSYYRIKIPRKNWLYAPNDRYGSDLYLEKRNFTSGNTARLSNIMNRALEPLIDQGRASDTDVTITQRARNGVGAEISVIDANGEKIDTYYVPVGDN